MPSYESIVDVEDLSTVVDSTVDTDECTRVLDLSTTCIAGPLTR